MKKLLYWIYSVISVISGMGVVATIELLNWVPLLCAVACVLSFLTSVYIEPDNEYTDDEIEGSRYDGDV